MKKLNTWLLIVGVLGCAAYSGSALHTSTAKADAQTLDASLLTSILAELVQIDQDIKVQPSCGCGVPQGLTGATLPLGVPLIDPWQ